MFPKAVETVLVTAADDLNTLLDRADDHPLVLERDGVRYVLNREDIGAYYDPEAVREAVETYAGLWSVEEAERMKEQLYRAREEGSRSYDRDPVPAR